MNPRFRSIALHALAPVTLLCAPSLLLAQAPAGKSVREVALSLAMTMTGHQMTACAKAHPAHEQRFTSSLEPVQQKLEAALDGLRPQRNEDLDLAVPEALIVGKEMMTALQASHTSLRTLESCNRTANEIANVSGREARDLMNQLVSTIVRGVSVHRSEMGRVLR